MSAGPSTLARIVSDAMASAQHDVAAFVREMKALEFEDAANVSPSTIATLIDSAAIMRRGAAALGRAAVLFELVASLAIEEGPK